MVWSRSYLSNLTRTLNNFRFNNSKFLVKYTPFYLKKANPLSIVSLKKKWKRYSNFYLNDFNFLFNRLAKSTKFSSKFFKMELKMGVNHLHLLFSRNYNHNADRLVISKLSQAVHQSRMLSSFVKFFMFSRVTFKFFRNFLLVGVVSRPWTTNHLCSVGNGLALIDGGVISVSKLRNHLTLSYKLLINSVECQFMSFNLIQYLTIQNLIVNNNFTKLK